jgi:hypothetical protein
VRVKQSGRGWPLRAVLEGEDQPAPCRRHSARILGLHCTRSKAGSSRLPGRSTGLAIELLDLGLALKLKPKMLVERGLKSTEVQQTITPVRSVSPFRPSVFVNPTSRHQNLTSLLAATRSPSSSSSWSLSKPRYVRGMWESPSINGL